MCGRGGCGALAQLARRLLRRLRHQRRRHPRQPDRADHADPTAEGPERRLRPRAQDIDFGLDDPGKASAGTVYLDPANQGVQDPNEPGLEGVTVILKDSNGNTMSIQATDANGDYISSSVCPPTTYTVGGAARRLHADCCRIPASPRASHRTIWM
ncbi:MAG: SdrD B-like domain-containing protein [Caldilineaceae bacterium]